MKNLLKETIEALGTYGKTIFDIEWIGTRDVIIPIEDFAKLANTVYDDSYGQQVVKNDLVVVGNGWWLERAEYDGSEWWEYKTSPTKPKSTSKFKSSKLIFY